MMLNYLENAHERIKIYNFEIPSQLVKDVELPGYGSVVAQSGGWDDYEWFFKFQTYIDPGSIYRLDLHSYQMKSLLTPQFENIKLNMSDFVTDQAWYKSKDGTKVPMYLIRKKKVLPSLDSIPK
jgi:prolyl oligopeptidase